MASGVSGRNFFAITLDVPVYLIDSEAIIMTRFGAASVARMWRTASDNSHSLIALLFEEF